ncbi:MAG TPA: hypothetical protein VKX29_03905 [Brumimicrobium sp.]|nr:hypothetical protein [Brumimicrobium sp.]
MKIYKIGTIMYVALFLVSCENKTNVNLDSTEPEKIALNSKNESTGLERVSKKGDISLFSGQAEIATYTLSKARYRENHPGEAVLIFVTEPFLVDRQVKADHPTPENSVNVLKLNRVDRFITGIYEYSQFTSVFTPSEIGKAKYPLKITMGSQDWCGQSYTQVNNKSGFEYQHKSYFASEGDTSLQLKYAYTGDNMMNLTRINPDLLPVGNFEILPSMHYLRTSQKEIKIYNANASLKETEEGYVYIYNIPELERSVKFYISSNNQYRIEKWEESYPTVFDGEMRTSVYELKGVKYIAYWEYNHAKDIDLRESFHLNY